MSVLGGILIVRYHIQISSEAFRAFCAVGARGLSLRG